jgi:hypothetical protein
MDIAYVDGSWNEKKYLQDCSLVEETIKSKKSNANY